MRLRRLYHRRLSRIAFTGNELIGDMLRALDVDSKGPLDARALSVVNVDQCYGLEIGAFSARIAEIAVWMMDHIMNRRLSLEYGITNARAGLRAFPRIIHGDALELDWSSVLPAHHCSHVLGNPPFAGAKYQPLAQRAQVRRIAAPGKSGGTLDYVSAWFIRAGEYVAGRATRIGFVATSSITQGQQVAQLWPILFGSSPI